MKRSMLGAISAVALQLFSPLSATAHGRGHTHRHPSLSSNHHAGSIATHRHGRHISAKHHPNHIDPHAPQSSLVMTSSGLILSISNPNQLVRPASTTKMMTLYLLFVALGNKWITDNTLFTVSKFASVLPPYDIPLQPGEKISVKDLSMFTPTVSLNAGARVIAENLAQFAPQYKNLLRANLTSVRADHDADESQYPSSPEDAAEWTKFVVKANQMIDGITSNDFGHETNPSRQKEIIFARVMTAFAQIAFDMRDTTYCNASGITDKEQVTTAVDQIKLAYQIGHLPQEYFQRYSIHNYQFRKWNVHNHNINFLTSYRGACGIKTGLTDSSGYNVVDAVCGSDGRPVFFADSFGSQKREERDNNIKAYIDAAQQALTNNTVPNRSQSDSDADNDTGELKPGDTLHLPPVFFMKFDKTINTIASSTLVSPAHPRAFSE